MNYRKQSAILMVLEVVGCNNMVQTKRAKVPTKRDMIDEFNSNLNAVYRQSMQTALRLQNVEIVVMAVLKEKFGITDDELQKFSQDYLAKKQAEFEASQASETVEAAEATSDTSEVTSNDSATSG